MPSSPRPSPASMPQPGDAPVREQAAEWAVRLDAGDLSPADGGRLAAWLAADPSHAQALQHAVSIWRALDAVPWPAPAGDAAHRPRGRPPVGRPRGSRRRRALLAAGMAGLLIILGYTQQERAAVWLHADEQTATGETRRVPLSGGSTAQLDTDSAIAVNDNAQRREVKVLAGTVSFEVGHTDARPFQVRTGRFVVTDVGTTFQLARSGNTARLVVASGLVEVHGPQGTETVRAGEQAELEPGSARPRVRPVDVEAATAWTRGRLVFVDRPLREVVEELNRYYDGRILLFGSAVAERRVSGVFRTSQPLAALNTIQQNLGLHARRLGAGLILLRD